MVLYMLVHQERGKNQVAQLKVKDTMKLIDYLLQPLCHNDRHSINIKGYHVCSRCFGMYLAGFLSVPIFWALSLFVSVDFFTASNGEDALNLIVNEKPDLVFLDVMMPKMNGLEVCRKVKLDLRIDGVSIIILTAKGQELDKKKGEEVGADLYMTKPFDPDKLLDKAREILEL